MVKNLLLKRKLLHHRILRKVFYRRIIDAFFVNCDSILDVGCGYGDFLRVAEMKGKTVIGVDINLQALLLLRRIGLDVVLCDVSHLPFRDRSIDGVFFSHVIEHIPQSDIGCVLKEIERIVKYNLVVVTPTEHRDFWTPGHVTSYDKDKLMSVLQEAGFLCHKVFYDKFFMLSLPDHEALCKIFNSLPFIWARMNIVAAATKLIIK